MTLLSEVIPKLRVYYPNSELRYTDEDLTDLVHAADCFVKEMAPIKHNDYTIELLAGVSYYILPSNVVSVMGVRYTSTGGSVKTLFPITIRELDDQNPSWNTSTGDPRHYSLKTCPGTVGSYIMLFPPGSGSIAVSYASYYPADTVEGLAEFAASEVDTWIIDTVYVPYILTMIFAGENPGKFQIYMQKFLSGMSDVQAHFTSKLPSLEGYRHFGSGFSDGSKI